MIMAYTRKKAQCTELEELMHRLFTHLSTDNTLIPQNCSPARTSRASNYCLPTISDHILSSDYELKHIQMQEVALPLAILSVELALLELRVDLGINDTWHGSTDACEDCMSGTVTGTRWWLDLRKSVHDVKMVQI